MVESNALLNRNAVLSLKWPHVVHSIQSSTNVLLPFVGRRSEVAPNALKFRIGLTFLAYVFTRLPSMELVGHDAEQLSAHYTHVGREALEKAAGSLPALQWNASGKVKRPATG